MMKNNIYFFLVIVLLFACKDKMPLGEMEFKKVLIDIHKLDATLASNHSLPKSDRGNNVYYEQVLKKYGITKEQFDSCMKYYSDDIKSFSIMYESIIDSLNKELTDIDMILAELKKNDTINIMPLADTISLDSVVVMTLDSIGSGYYSFTTRLLFDSVSENRLRRIVARFISSDNLDTLSVFSNVIMIDTVVRNYSWNQYIDSVYTRLEVTYMEEIPYSKRIKVRKEDDEWEIPIDTLKLEDFGGRALEQTLNKKYQSRSTIVRMQKSVESRRSNERNKKNSQ